MVPTPRPRPAGLTPAHVLRFPRTGVLCGWRPGCPGPRRRGGHRGVCTHGDLRALTLKGPERSRLWCITSQGLRYQRLVSGSPGGRLCCRCPLYSTLAQGVGGEGRPPRRPLALSLQHLRGLGGRRRPGLGEKAPSRGSRSGQKAVGGDLSCCLAGRREEGDHRLESQEGS